MRMGMREDSEVVFLRAAAMVFLPPLLLLLPPSAAGLWINVPASGSKCVSEEIHANVVVLADYSAIYETEPHGLAPIAAKVSSPYGNTLHQKENTTSGQFAFTTTESGNYLACFWQDGDLKNVEAAVSLNWKIGIAAKDWESVAKKEKIEGVELELRKLEASVEAIHENLLYLKAREVEMRDVSEKTNSRVARFSIMSLGVCIAASAVQLWHLQGFFQKKKLI